MESILEILESKIDCELRISRHPTDETDEQRVRKVAEVRASVGEGEEPAPGIAISPSRS